MSSQLVPFTFNKVDLVIVKFNGKEWCRAKEVCLALKYKKDTSDIIHNHCSSENIQHKYQLSGPPISGEPISWPKDSQKYDLYINEEGLYELIFTSQQPLAKQFRKHCCNILFPHIRQQLHQQAIEEKETALALLTDDLQERDNQIQAIQYENVGLQGEIRAKNQQIDHLMTRYVEYARDPGKDNVVIIIRKHSTQKEDEFHHFPYYAARIQKRLRSTKRHWFAETYRNYEEIVEIDNPNAIHSFNRFEEEGHVQRYRCHFKLVDLTRDDLYALGIPAIDE